MLAAALLAGPASLRAQDSAEVLPPTPALVEGRVVTPAGVTVTPIPGAMVTLHRVGTDHAGPVDSVRSDPDGRYRISYVRDGRGNAVWFAAVLYRGIAYFSAPLQLPRVTGDEAEIVVFDTTTHALPFSIQGHHVVVAAPGADGMRRVTEVYELSNDTTVTVMGRDSLAAVWSTALPSRATGFEGGQGDVSPVSLVARGGRAQMLAPFGPGIKQFSYSYSLPSSAFPLELVAERFTGVFEVLVEEPGANVLGASLRAQGNVTTQGRTFKRFLSQGTPQGESVRIDVPIVASDTRVRVLVGLGVAIALVMAGALWAALRRRGRGAPVAPARPRSEGLVAAIATLDERREAGDASLTTESYAAERASLKRALAAALERERD